MMTTELAANMSFLLNETMSMVRTICMVFVGVAIFDFVYQMFDYNKKLKMDVCGSKRRVQTDGR